MSSFAVPKPRRPVETTSTKQEPTSTVSPSSTLNSESPVSHSHSKGNETTIDIIHVLNTRMIHRNG
jgi:hypothetical protein